VPVYARMAQEPQVVLAVGPPAHLVGGMANVADQVLRLDGTRAARVVRFDTTIAPDGGESMIRRIARHRKHLAHLHNEIRRCRASIVHIHTCSGFSFYRSAADMRVARRAGCRTVLHIHGASFDTFVAKSHIVARSAIRRTLHRANRVVALAESWKEKIRRVAPHARVAVIENAIDIPQSTASPGQRGTCRIVLLAKMDTWKGIEDLLVACSILRKKETPPFNLDLAGPPGSAGDASSLARIIRERGLEDVVRYRGLVRGKAKDELLRQAHAYVQPSHHEGMPLAVLEAMAYGLPIVATRVGAVPEVVHDGTHGLLTRPHQPVELAEALCRLIENHELRANLGANARAMAVSRFSLVRFHNDLQSLYDAVTGRMPPPLAVHENKQFEVYTSPLPARPAPIATATT